LTGADVGQAATNGDAFALGIVHEAMGWLGLGLVNLLHLFNPQIVVMGGSLTRLDGLLWNRIHEVVNTHILSPGFQPEHGFQRAALMGDVCLVGAAFYAKSSFET
ncbi:MAG: ROK family protein, partial [Chloroflexota bacterium]